MLGIYIQGRAFLWPRTAGVDGPWKGYWEGLKRTGQIYVAVMLTLLVSAIYEVLEVILYAKLFH